MGSMANTARDAAAFPGVSEGSVQVPLNMDNAGLDSAQVLAADAGWVSVSGLASMKISVAARCGLRVRHKLTENHQ